MPVQPANGAREETRTYFAWQSSSGEVNDLERSPQLWRHCHGYLAGRRTGIIAMSFNEAFYLNHSPGTGLKPTDSI